MNPIVAAIETAVDIDATAAKWVARADRRPLTPDEMSELEAWLSGDVRRPGAYGRAQAVLIYAKRAVALGPDYRGRAEVRDGKGFKLVPGGLSRRQVFWGGGAVAASMAGALVVLSAVDSQAQVLTTEKGEARAVPLKDGSLVNLNTDTHLRALVNARHRRVDLEAGEALFEVAKDPTRPFTVNTENVEFVALGTSFVVRRLNSHQVVLLVRDGLVDVRLAGSDTIVRVGAGERLKVDSRMWRTAGATPESLSPDELSRSLAWQGGHIALEGQTLAEAVAEFARYNDKVIVITDPAIAAHEITGLFEARNPGGFASAVAAAYSLTVIEDTHQYRLVAKAS
ncbi:FecR domain-containing protein [Asticcacaulis sp. BYS171W]|uniref:FecR domain-containing protein n=1 Tax=Asticcacaulis aquaticus TaxID=2984212 RepID=A0ABT5HPX6_9CAUL|nr:FecR domain-containing protein [Asticcacaulis aquaticus]MDC7682120.1 FecR domain-containing protein [Asticcacaulis aquaticus]